MQIDGFKASAVQAGIRYPDRLDLGLIVSTVPAVTAGAFTTNKVKAAPVLLDMERLKLGKAQAILVNSGNANACNGEQGMHTAIASAKLAASHLGIEEDLVQVASTGVIGEQMAIEPFERSMDELVAGLAADGFAAFSEAILTTDLVTKISRRSVDINGTQVSLLGIAKGSGMIMPDMATMLCFVVTDAQIVYPVLQEMVLNGVERSFNRITVDGDTSTNDMVLVMANGVAGNDWIDEGNPQGSQIFAEALTDLMHDLALQIVADGEGATKVVTVRVRGAREYDCAMSAAQTIANSALVKTAFFGEDANWGRIIAALGRSECVFSPDKIAISFDDVVLVKNGMAVSREREAQAAQVLKKKEFILTVDLNDGRASAEVYTCDFSYDYVTINADYRS